MELSWQLQTHEDFAVALNTAGAVAAHDIMSDVARRAAIFAEFNANYRSTLMTIEALTRPLSSPHSGSSKSAEWQRRIR